MNYTNVVEQQNSIIIEDVKDFNIKQILECGQCFRWERITDTNYIIVAFRRVIEVVQEGNKVIIYNTNMKDFNEIWKSYFDLDRDYGVIKEELSKDELLRKSVEFGYGIRILNQDPFEILISFIISARNSIPSIMKTIKKISEKWGDKLEYKGNIYYAFPTPEQLKKATLDEIKETGASFRSKYIVDTIGNVNAAIEAKQKGELTEELRQFDLDYIKSLPSDECHKALQNFMGVGAKVADCIMLFSMGKHSAFPVDVWIKRAMIHFYLAPDVSLNKIRVFGREKFGELSGLAQQYLFYYARENNIKIEE
ncbi:DNA-3-methyladenine glycosylase family protein [Clostridium celatum]|mgnify:FL=1|uniref:DNA-3-methyladenine glycosylase family protein n=1 Tax=Clostridium celatum TaxID=36834 RepID=UPI00189BC317|nr:DNA-3-methyladenine glycosylase 2 family protein [Clostridium celatum]MCE9654951.1 8-oxoguanine DNA glycosylase [Clostridium celatum]MDY3360106.1 DNA glycosylase [Clostridium celatum]